MMKILKRFVRITTGTLLVMLIFMAGSITASAAEYDVEVTLENGADYWIQDSRTYHITTNGTIKGIIRINSGFSPTIYLDNAKIDNSSDSGNGIFIGHGATLNLYLIGDNVIKGGSRHPNTFIDGKNAYSGGAAGIFVPENSSLNMRHGTQAEEYLRKIQQVLTNVELTIDYALGESTDDKSGSEEPENIEALKGMRVLVVDDNKLNREIMKEVLVDHGLTVEEAGNGSEAVAAVRANEPGYYHFILMDIEMPVMDGFEATVKIRNLPNRIRANIPIIALTANAVSENRERAAVVGMDDFLVKPTNSTRLLRSLAEFQ